MRHTRSDLLGRIPHRDPDGPTRYQGRRSTGGARNRSRNGHATCRPWRVADSAAPNRGRWSGRRRWLDQPGVGVRRHHGRRGRQHLRRLRQRDRNGRGRHMHLSAHRPPSGEGSCRPWRVAATLHRPGDRRGRRGSRRSRGTNGDRATGSLNPGVIARITHFEVRQGLGRGSGRAPRGKGRRFRDVLIRGGIHNESPSPERGLPTRG